MSIVKIGDIAKDFDLSDQDEKEVRLSSFKGKRVLLSFHPLAWTKVCAEQMKSLEKNHDRFEKLNTVALGISVDTVPSKKAWAKELGIKNTRLLSDFWPHGKVAGLYGIFREKEGVSERANIIIDENSKVVFVKVYPISQFPDIKEIIKVLEDLEQQ
ncbi:MAG: peroxiredoxin [Candidatus Methanoperedens sp.]|nr:peroxiredoxin [Candidatus Methanoperedens sp.]CAG0953953.1 Alkyl hydroperoxide reductase E [Methanosarcinales archaeon]